MNFGPVSAVDHMAIGNDAIIVDEESAAARKFFAARVEGLDGHGGRLDATHQFRQLVLRAGVQLAEHSAGEHDENGDEDKARASYCFHSRLVYRALRGFARRERQSCGWLRRRLPWSSGASRKSSRRFLN